MQSAPGARFSTEVPKTDFLDCLQSVSLSFLYRNNTRKEHAGHEIETRTARRIAAAFCERPLTWDLNYSTDLKRKGGLQAVYRFLGFSRNVPTLLTAPYNVLVFVFRFAAAAIAAFGAISLDHRAEKVPIDSKTKFNEVAEEKSLVLHDNLEVRDR